MTGSDILVLAWLVLAHLVADFLLQTDRVVADKFGDGRRAWRGLAMHGAAVALCLVPFALAFGVPGLGLLVAVTIGHVLIDRWKTLATRAAERRAAASPVAAAASGSDAAAGGRADPEAPEALGPAWTPVPAMLFVLDQAFHLALIGVAWIVFLARTAPTVEWVSVLDAVLRGFPRDQFHLWTGVLVVVASLLIVNVRAGAFFVATLVRPRERGGAARVVPLEPPPPVPALPATWRFRLGPIKGIAEPSWASSRASAAGAATGPVLAGATSVASSADAGHASPIRIGATIGVLERLLIVIFVLSGAVAAIGFVVAAKTLARFKQLDDRDFAEYYLLGTLASVSVGLGSALVAQAAITALGG